MEWLLQQAQTASPFVAVFCMMAAGVLYRQHIKDQATILSMAESMGKATIATAIAMEKLSSAVREATKGRR